MTSKQQGVGVQRGGHGGRSARSLAGLIGIGVLVVGSIAACDSRDDSTDVSSPSTEAVTEPTADTQTDSAESTAAPTTAPSPTTTLTAEPVTMIDVEPVAVAAGERWLVDDLEDGDELNMPLYLAALNGSVMLVGADTGEWMRYDLTVS